MLFVFRFIAPYAYVPPVVDFEGKPQDGLEMFETSIVYLCYCTLYAVEKKDVMAERRGPTGTNSWVAVCLYSTFNISFDPNPSAPVFRCAKSSNIFWQLP